MVVVSSYYLALSDKWVTNDYFHNLSRTKYILLVSNSGCCSTGTIPTKGFTKLDTKLR